MKRNSFYLLGDVVPLSFFDETIFAFHVTLTGLAGPFSGPEGVALLRVYFLGRG